MAFSCRASWHISRHLKKARFIVLSVVFAFKYCSTVNLLMFWHASMRYKTELENINHAVAIARAIFFKRKIYNYKRKTCNFQSQCTGEVHFLNNSWEKVAHFSSMRYKTERVHINHAVARAIFFFKQKIYNYNWKTCNFQSHCTEEVHFLNNSREKIAHFRFGKFQLNA